MFSFISRRLLAGLGTLLVSTFAMYLLVSKSIRPFEDLESLTDGAIKAQRIAERIEILDLNTNPVIRYFKWLGNFVTGDLGVGWRSGQPVTSLLQGAVASTIQLVAAATVLAIILGVMIGIVSALRQYSALRLHHDLPLLPPVLPPGLLGRRAAQAVGGDRLQRLPQGSSLSPLVIAVAGRAGRYGLDARLRRDSPQRLITFGSAFAGDRRRALLPPALQLVAAAATSAPSSPHHGYGARLRDHSAHCRTAEPPRPGRRTVHRGVGARSLLPLEARPA